MNCGFIFMDECYKIILIKTSDLEWSFPKVNQNNISIFTCAKQNFIEKTGITGVTYSFCSIPYIKDETSTFYICKIISKHKDYYNNANFFSLNEIDQLKDIELKIMAYNAINNYNNYDFDMIDVIITEQKKKKVSVEMSKLLRHELSSFKYVKDDGYVLLIELINRIKIKENKENILEIVNYIVRTCTKQRFQIDDDKIHIRAVQAYSFDKIDHEKLATLIKEPLYNVIHMTFSNNIKEIKKNGISKMNRSHIHFAQESHLLRSGCDIKIIVNMDSAMKDGILFFIANNGVIISPGNKDGFIPFKHLKIKSV
jgi:2'-phosphotransferase